MTTEHRPSFSGSVSLGNLLQIAVTIVAVAGAYFTIDARSAANAERIRAIESQKNVDREQADRLYSSIEARVRNLEEQYARSDERLANMLTLLTRIDDRLERIELDSSRAP